VEVYLDVLLGIVLGAAVFAIFLLLFWLLKIGIIALGQLAFDKYHNRKKKKHLTIKNK